jgi:hypothetical protein
MKFEVFHHGLLGRADIIAVDMIHYSGMWGLCFSHHPPHNNHPRYAADTSTAGVLRFLEACLGGYADIAWEDLSAHTITTHHFDSDALLPVWALRNPVAALEHRNLLESVARCGDFFLYLDERSAKLNFSVEALQHRLRGTGRRGERLVDDALTRACFDWALPRWSEWMDDPERGADLWDGPMREMHADLQYLAVPGRITELWDRHTSLVETEHDPDVYALNTLCRNDLLLIWRTDTPERRLDVRPAIGWYEITSLPHCPRYDLKTLAARLNAAEMEVGHGPVWEVASGPVSLGAACSRLSQETLLDILRDWLDSAPEEAVSSAYRADVQEVFRHLPHPAVLDSHQRFAAASELCFTPSAAYGGLHFRPTSGAERRACAPDRPAALCAFGSKTPLAFAVSDDFYWNRRHPLPLELQVVCEDSDCGHFWIEYDTWTHPFQPTPPVTLYGDGKVRTLSLPFAEARFGNSQEGGDFRLMHSPGTRLTIRELVLRKLPQLEI